MSRETTDTNNQFSNEIPNGTHMFEVRSVQRKEIKGKVGYEWRLDYRTEDGTEGTGKQLFWPNQLGGLLSVLNCKEGAKKGVYEWDTDMQQGKEFIATVSRKADKKDPTKLYQVMEGFKRAKAEDAEIPF